jgi:hypothetical protein
VQFCDDVAIGGGLDWEFASFAPWASTGRKGRMDGHQAQKEDGRFAGVAS